MLDQAMVMEIQTEMTSCLICGQTPGGWTNKMKNNVSWTKFLNVFELVMVFDDF